MALTPKQERFCREYVIDLNGTQAAIRAGYSKKTANEQAARLLANVSVKEFVKALQSEIGKRLDITADRVLQELAKIGYSNVQDFIKTGNEIRDFSLLDRDIVAPVASIKVTEISTEQATKTTTEFKLHDKVAALVSMGKHTGIFEKDNAQKATSISVRLNK